VSLKTNSFFFLFIATHKDFTKTMICLSQKETSDFVCLFNL